MIKSLIQKFIFYVRENTICCAACAAALLCGAVIGVVCAFSLDELSAKELSLYLGDFFSSFTQAGTDSSMIFSNALRQQILFFIIMLLSSGLIFGSLFIAATGAYVGFSFGFTTAFFLKLYGMRTLLLLLLGVLPHAFISFPVYVAALCVCMRFSVSLAKERGMLKKRLLTHVLLLAALFLVAFSAVLLQAYVEPLLMGLVAKYFI